jgi:hydrogenase/urease accessory protein HupE
MRRLRHVAAALLFAVLGFAPRAQAHLGNISYADFTVRGNEVLLEFKYAAHVTPGLAQQPTNLTRAQLMSHSREIEDWLSASSFINAGGKLCRMELDNVVGPDRNQDLVLTVIWTCDVTEIKGLLIDFHPLDAGMSDWQTIASLKMAGQSYSSVLTPGATRWQIGEVADPAAGAAGDDEREQQASAGGSAFGRFFQLGVWHIWTGYDHLLFLLAVLLAGGGIARIAGIVTSFTVAHSITLGAAATGLVRLPVAPVEAAIALSIVFVAAENLLERGADRRAIVTFFFGLIHGFGFASVLAETALPTGGILVPLLAFNLGVEAGQLAVVLAVVPPLTIALRSRYGRSVKLVLSALIALAGAAWAFERIAAIVR